MSDRVPIGLCLGMYLNPDRDCTSRKQKSYGLEYRDKVRCKKLEELLSIKAVTLCKDKDLKLNNHIRSNFNQSKELLTDINATFPEGGFEYILYVFLDHFHSPDSWAYDWWKKGFVEDFLPYLALSGLLVLGGTVWLPNLNTIKEMLENSRQQTQDIFTIEYINDPKLNPFHQAIVETRLELEESGVDMDKQLNLLNHEFPFIKLTNKLDIELNIFVDRTIIKPSSSVCNNNNITDNNNNNNFNNSINNNSRNNNISYNNDNNKNNNSSSSSCSNRDDNIKKRLSSTDIQIDESNKLPRSSVIDISGDSQDNAITDNNNNNNNWEEESHSFPQEINYISSFYGVSNNPPREVINLFDDSQVTLVNTPPVGVVEADLNSDDSWLDIKLVRKYYPK